MTDPLISANSYLLTGIDSIHTCICFFHRTHETLAARPKSKPAHGLGTKLRVQFSVGWQRLALFRSPVWQSLDWQYMAQLAQVH